MKQTSKSQLDIWVLTDNKLGHRNQLQGLISALSVSREVTVRWISVESHFQGIVELVFGGFSKKLKKKPDFLLAAGHRTHLKLIAFKKYLHKPIVVMMKPSLPLSWFDLCLIPRHDHPSQSPHVIETVGAINRVIPSISKIKNTGLIMLGGPSKHYCWKDLDVVNELKKLLKTTPEIKWQMGSSRRTPESLFARLKSQLPELDVTTPDSVDKDWLSQEMQKAEYIWVSEDSVSMVYEAMTSGAQTGILRLAKDKETRITKEMHRLVEEGRVASLDRPLETAPPPINEAQRCANVLLEMLEL